jgi:hypothetical protein
MVPGPTLPEHAQEARRRIAHRLIEVQTVLLALSEDTRGLKQLTVAGHPTAEIEIAAETIEQFLVITGAFAENIRGRFEARLGVLRRGEPVSDGKPDRGPRHGTFWMAFSRLSAAVRRLEGRG